MMIDPKTELEKMVCYEAYAAFASSEVLEEKLKNQYGADGFEKILDGFRARRPVTLRVNPLKTDKRLVCSALCAAGIRFREVSWYGDALILEDVREDRIRELECYREGGVYLQSLSSMLPPLLLRSVIFSIETAIPCGISSSRERSAFSRIISATICLCGWSVTVSSS